jgi:hypothetical protein
MPKFRTIKKPLMINSAEVFYFQQGKKIRISDQFAQNLDKIIDYQQNRN